MKWLKKIWKKIANFWNYRYDSEQCRIRRFGKYPSKVQVDIDFRGNHVLLMRGNYSVSCPTPDGMKIRYIRVDKDNVIVKLKDLFQSKEVHNVVQRKS